MNVEEQKTKMTKLWTESRRLNSESHLVDMELSKRETQNRRLKAKSTRLWDKSYSLALKSDEIGKQLAAELGIPIEKLLAELRPNPAAEVAK